MKAPEFRLIYGPRLTPAERKAAAKGLKRFRTSGIDFKVMPLGEDAVRGVKMGAQFLETLGPGGPVHLKAADFLVPRLGKEYHDAMHRTDVVVGIGLTDEPMLMSVRGPRDQAEQKVGGASRYRGGAFVTVAGLRDFFGFDPKTGAYGMHPKTAMHAVELAVCREASHTLIDTYGRSIGTVREESHCNHLQCLMKETADTAHFVEHVVKAGLDLCKECERRIRMEIGLLLDSDTDD